MDVNSRPLRRLAHRPRVDGQFDWPRLWCAATTAAGVVALGAVGASPVPATQQHHAAAIARTATGDSLPLHAAMPPTPDPRPSGTAAGKAGGVGPKALPVSGGAIPPLVLTAYLDAERSVAAGEPGCHLSWQMLAGIGEVESGQADNGDLAADGTTRTPILGPLLDGSGGNAAVPAPNGGWARAEGPMQFLPTTWAQWGVDGNGDGIANPDNIFDAALAAGHYLCAGGRDLARTADLNAAILSYNHSPSYLATVTAWIAYYRNSPGAGTSGGPGATAGGPASGSPRPTPSGSSARPTASPTPTGTSTGPTRTPSPTGLPSGSPSPSSGPTTGGTGSPSPSGPTCPSADPTPTGTGSPTGSGSATADPTGTPTPSPSPTGTGSASPTGTGSPSPSPTPTGCPSPTGTVTASPSPSAAN